MSPREPSNGTEARSRHTEIFVRAFESLQASAAQGDPDGMISKALEDSVNGRVYRFMVGSRPDRAAV